MSTNATIETKFNASLKNKIILAQAPPGNNTQSPSELYWNQLDNQGSRTGENDFG